MLCREAKHIHLITLITWQSISSGRGCCTHQKSWKCEAVCIVYNMSLARSSSPTADRYRNVESLLYPISVLPSCCLSKTSRISSRHSLTRARSMLNTMQNLTLNLASHVTMSSSPLLVSIYSLSNAIIFMHFSIALIMFDTLLTLPSEIKCIWCRKRRLGSVLYFLARYPVLALLIIEIYRILFVISLQVCQC